MATAQYDSIQGQHKPEVAVVLGGAIGTSIARVTVDTSKPKSEALKALMYIVSVIQQGKAWPPV